MVELDDLTVVLGKLPALMSRTELELSLHDLDEPRELHRARTEPDLSDSILLRQTVRSRGPPHRSLRQDWKRFLVPIGRYACATFEGPPSSRSRATLLAPSASGVMLRTPLVVTPMQAVITGPRRAPRSILRLTSSSRLKRASRAG